MNKYLPFLLLFSITNLFAQDYKVDLSYYLPKGITYNQNIPTPKSVIGHEVGEWHVTHDKLVQYMYALEKASDRITIESRGTTFEGRPLLLLTITSPENQGNISSIQRNHVALTEPNANSLNTATMPVVVYQGFSIHGNESSGSNAALVLAYHLAAGQGPEMDQLLNDAVVLLDPCFNPDGLQRFAYWANVHKSQNINPDPNDREYREVWPGGRTNHYWFDMNRDWLPVQLPESRARIATFHKWYPNILTDHHEMGSNATFFFQPGVPSRSHPLIPQKNQDLTGAIGAFHAKALNQLGSLYYTEENFDDFYFGKGSTFPDINGAVGILFEQASSRGHAQETVNGILTFPFTIRNQFTAALSTLEAAESLSEDLLNYQRNFFSEALKEGKNEEAIVFGDEKDAGKTFHLAEILERHKIVFHELKEDFTENGKTYRKGYSYVIPKKQKHHRLINAMFERRTQFKDSLFYDVSAWTFPLAFNVDYIENASMSRAGDRVTKLEFPVATEPESSTYAYLMEWHEYYTPEALNMILQKGIRAKVGMRPFKLENRSYDYGTVLIPVQNQKLSAEELSNFIKEVVRKTHVAIQPVSTGLTQGIDLGSSQFRLLKAPKIAILVGDGVRSYDAGEIWHLLDTRYNMHLTKIDTRNFSGVDLSRYTDIILPSFWGSALDKGDAEKLKTWVRSGGTLIAYRNVGRWLNEHDILKMTFKTKSDTARNIPFDQRNNYSGAKVIGGAIFNTQLDRSHPIAFGYKNDQLPMFRNTTIFLKPAKNSFHNPIQYTSKPLLGGYVSDSNLEQLKNSVPFRTANFGRGQVIYFTDNTNFRAFWYGTNKLLMNAVFFGDEM